MEQKTKPDLLFYKNDYNEQQFKMTDMKRGYRKKPISAIPLKKGLQHCSNNFF